MIEKSMSMPYLEELVLTANRLEPLCYMTQTSESNRVYGIMLAMNRNMPP